MSDTATLKGGKRWNRALPWDPDAADPADPAHGALKPSMATLDGAAVFEIRSDDVERFTALTGAKLPLDVGAGTFVGTSGPTGSSATPATRG
ncbi:MULTISPECIES: hypothetical protein [unclassified Micromonospora]|uniref:hypothetical protein n=1 Tax=unclassified Micromonospora TaxID=2617518 RepID=UPI00340315A4